MEISFINRKSKYLGIILDPTCIVVLNSSLFFLKTMPKSKCLVHKICVPGRYNTLIKSVLQAPPTYTMQTKLLTKKSNNDLDTTYIFSCWITSTLKKDKKLFKKSGRCHFNGNAANLKKVSRWIRDNKYLVSKPYPFLGSWFGRY